MVRYIETPPSAEKFSGEGTHLPLRGMCPQFSLQVMMGIGTPMA